MINKSIITLLILCCVSNNSFAHVEGEDQLYLKLYHSVNILENTYVSDKHLNPTAQKSKLNNGYGIGLGHHLNDTFKVDLNIETLNYEFYDLNISNSYIENNINIQDINNIKKIAFGHLSSLNFYYDFIKKDHFSLFIGTGIGCAMIKEKISKSSQAQFVVNGEVFNLPLEQKKNNSKTNCKIFGSMILGANIILNDKLNLDISYVYRDFNSIKNNNNKSNYMVHNILTGISLHF